MSFELKRDPSSGAVSPFARSLAYRARAEHVLPRGVSSSPRATQRPAPLVIARAAGAHITDLDGRTYIDYSLGYGPLLLGHDPAPVLAAVQREMALGLRTGGITSLEAELAERIAHVMPSCQMSAFVSTGTEAAQLALRLARAVTRRLTVVKFRCHYHGWSDAIHVATDPANDGPSTGGQDPDALRHVKVLDWGDSASLEALAPEDVAGRGPGRIYGDGLGRAIAMVVGEDHLVFARTFGAMAFSTFVFDTIDVATRLGRYILEELFGWQTQQGLRAKAGHAGATLLTIAPPAIVLATAVSTPGQPPAYMKFWTLFGTSNQLLAALTLMGVAMWLWSEGRRVWFVVLPMIFVFGITVWALLVQVVHTKDLVLRGTAAALLALAALVSFEVYRVVRRGRPPAAPARAE